MMSPELNELCDGATNGKDNDSLKSVSEILKMGYDLYIPSYQRGYRWGQDEVLQLLQDIEEQKDDEPYFLQLLAVREDKENKRLHVIDGQQRLTTCLLALQCCETDNLPKLVYKTRENSLLDSVFLQKAKDVITAHLKGTDTCEAELKRRLESRILNANFLYYQVDEGNEMSLFHRLNMWKIPALDSELVKCVVLSSSEHQDRAFYWNEIERRLNNDAFFSFITRSDSKESATRFGEFLYIALEDEIKAADKISKFPLFSVMEATKDSDALWKKIVSSYKKLIAWYDNPYLYHLLGWSLHRRDSGLQRLSLNINSVKEAKESAMKVGGYRQADLEFGVSDEKVRHYLFLANVAFCALSYSPRYRFDKHSVKNPRSIEHIHARNQHMLTNDEYNRLFVAKVAMNEQDVVKDYYSEYVNTWKDGRGFDAEEGLCKKCRDWKIEYAYPDGNIDNTIGNLALLTDSMNSSFNNGTFVEKQSRVLQDWAPPLSVAVFKKMVPGIKNKDPIWDMDSREIYKRFLEKVISQFFELGQTQELWGKEITE